MIKMKTFKILIVLLYLPLIVSCGKKEETYFNFVDMFKYVKKNYENKRIYFGDKDRDDGRYLIDGWSVPQERRDGSTKIRTFRWAVNDESIIKLNVADLSEKEVTMICEPFNIDGLPRQKVNVYVNDLFLKSFEMRNWIATYRFKIKPEFLKYGENIVAFKWHYPRSPSELNIGEDTRKLCARFFDFKLGNSDGEESNSSEPEEREKVEEVISEITTHETKEEKAILIPSGGIIEYGVDLPKKPTLKFGLMGDPSANFTIFVNSEDDIEKRYDYKLGNDTESEKINIDLSEFSKKYVNFIISVSSQSDAYVAWQNPVISSSSKREESYWGIFSKEKIAAEKNRTRTDNSDKKPHVFIYLVDTLRADHLGCYGYHKETSPFIDEFSAEGVLFVNAFANASWTKPTVASLLTGMYPNKHGAEDRPDVLPDSVAMLPEILQSSDYHTLYIISNGNVAREFNFDQGNDYYEVVTPHDYTSSELINKAFFNWFSENGEKVDKPLFAYLHTVDPHHPYTPKEPFLKFKIEDKEREGLAIRQNVLRKKRREGLSGEDIEYIISLYDCEILHNDYYFQEFINFLKEKNLYDDSIIVILGDHGEQFDEHGELYHGLSIYNEEIQVPIIIKFPHKEFEGYRPKFIMTQVDILPTILDYLGIPFPKGVDGISVLNHLEKKIDNINRTVMIKEKLNFESWKGVSYVGFILKNEKHIIRYPRYDYADIKSYEVYDLEKDPDERENRNIFVSRMGLLSNKIKFHTDSVLHDYDKLTFSLNEKINLKDLPEEKIKALKALGYIR